MCTMANYNYLGMNVIGNKFVSYFYLVNTS